MMKKKSLVTVLALFAATALFAQEPAQARKHHNKHSHHVAQHRVKRAHAARGYTRAAQRHRLSYRHAERLEHAGQGGRPRAWCGWWLGHHLGVPRRDLWQARNWASAGQAAGGPGIGVVVVWRHHVGVITGRSGSEWIVKSGNDGRAVRERPRSIAGAIAFRHVGGGAAI